MNLRIRIVVMGVAALAVGGGCTGLLGDFEVGNRADDPNADGSLVDAAGPGADAADHLLALDKPTYDFGTTVVGATIAPVTFTVTNRGSAPTGVLTTNTSAGFSITNDRCSNATLGPNATCVVNVAPDTSVAGSHAGTLGVSEGANDSVQAHLSANVATPGALSITPATQPFGSVVPGSQSSDFTFQLKNTGATTSGAITTSITGNYPTDFSTVTDQCKGVKLAAQGTCNVTLRFKPASAVGLENATLVAAASPGGTTIATLMGTSVKAGAVSFNPSSVAFGTFDTGSPSMLNDVVTNTGGAATSALVLTISGANAADFATSGCSGQSLAAGAPCTVHVTFTPGARGSRSASLDVTGVPGGTVSLPLTGTGRDSVALTIAKSGTGDGTITSDDGNVNCPAGACSEQVPRTSTTDPIITLTEVPDAVSTFTGWSGGGCVGMANTCKVTMSQAQSVTAMFTAKTITITVASMGLNGQTGIVTSSDGQFNCGATCGPISYNATLANTITLTATPGGGNTFIGWSGAGCQGTKTTCTLPLTNTTSVTATFGSQQYMFVTSKTYIPGNLGGLAGADAACSTLATAAGLPGTYKAWLSSSVESAKTRVGSGGWVRTDGRPFAANLAGVTAAIYAIFYPPRVDELGNDLGPVQAFVAGGHNGQGQSFGSNTCTDYTSINGGLYVGQAAGGSQVWSYDQLEGAGCSTPHRLYCMRSDTSATISVTNMPGRHVFVSSGTLSGSGGRGAGDTVCRSEASSASLANAGTFFALMATNGASAASRLNLAGTPWKRVDNVFVVSNAGDLIVSGGQLIAAIDLRADGTQYVGSDTWSGAIDPNTVGTDATTCKNWSSASAADTGTFGYSTKAVSPDWFKFFTPYSCASNFQVLCFEP